MAQVYFAGMDIGGTKISVLITDDRGRIKGRAKKKSRVERGVDAVLERATATVHEACADAQVSVEHLVAVGVGAPSPILPDGTAIAAPNMGWKNLALTKRLRALLSRPVYAENDCNVGTFGEFSMGGHSSAKTLIGLFMGTGLGGGVVKDGQIITGENSMASEVGHMTIFPGGRPCGCGKRGCLEAYASKKGMGYAFKEAILLERRPSLLTELVENENYDNVRSSLLRTAWDRQDVIARQVLREAATYLGIAAGNLITLLGPNVIVLGGGVMQALGQELLPIVRETAAAHTFPTQSFKDTRVELATLGDDAVALGAIAYARSRLAGDNCPR